MMTDKAGMLWTFCCIFAFAMPLSARSMEFCKGAEIPITTTLDDMPIRITGNLLQSGLYSAGNLTVINSTSKTITHIVIQVRYSGQRDEFYGIITYGLTTIRRALPFSYFIQQTREAITPGKETAFLGIASEIFSDCPKMGSITAIDIVFSDGTEYERQRSALVVDVFPLASPVQEIALGRLPTRDSSYLLRLTIDEAGYVVGIEQVAPKGDPFPEELGVVLRKWVFQPYTIGDQAFRTEIFALLQIVRSCRKLGECEIRLPTKDLPRSFVLISTFPKPAEKNTESLNFFYGFWSVWH